jgi:hypothetical protein
LSNPVVIGTSAHEKDRWSAVNIETMAANQRNLSSRDHLRGY